MVLEPIDVPDDPTVEQLEAAEKACYRNATELRREANRYEQIAVALYDRARRLESSR